MDLVLDKFVIFGVDGLKKYIITRLGIKKLK